MTNKEKYRLLCDVEKTIPIFSQAWWLDAVAGESGWDVVLLEKGGHYVATLPYAIRKKFGFTAIGMPPLTQSLGPWIKYPQNQKLGKRYAYEKDVIQQLIKGLPQCSGFVQNFHPSITNWLPLYWLGFSQTTNYSYVLDELSNLDSIWDAFLDNVRTDIRKASKIVKVDKDASVEEFLVCHQKVFERQGMQLPYSLSVVQRLDQAAVERGQRRIFLAKDQEGKVHAGVYLVWDDSRAYYLMGAGDPELRSSGATSLAMWEAIQFAATVTKSFDFEGSMLEPVERYFRAFGARQSPYFQISRRGRFWSAVNALSTLSKSVLGRC